MNRLLATGEDGTRYIDYLRASASEFDSFGDYLDFLDRHAALIRDNLKKKMTGNVRRKFEWLAHYHNRVASEHLDRFRKSKDASAAFEDEFEIEAIPYFEALFVQ